MRWSRTRMSLFCTICNKEERTINVKPPHWSRYIRLLILSLVLQTLMFLIFLSTTLFSLVHLGTKSIVRLFRSISTTPLIRLPTLFIILIFHTVRTSLSRTLLVPWPSFSDTDLTSPSYVLHSKFLVLLRSITSWRSE